VTVLLLDLGNTALKWASLHSPDSSQTVVHAGEDSAPEALLQEWVKLRPRRVVGCMVSSEMLALSLTKFFNQQKIQWEWLRSEPAYCGDIQLTNTYEDVRQLGSDRWHAAIGAASLYPNRALLVAQFGTASTVDAVVPKPEGGMEFRGGRILAGPSLMLSSLMTGTRCRPEGIGVRRAFPRNTTDAIGTGIIEAHIGVLEHAQCALREEGFEPTLVFAGGAAPLLAPYILEAFPEAIQKHNLVLRGLAMRARLTEGNGE